MQHITNFIIYSIEKASKLLRRDFLDLELRQNSINTNVIFCQNAYDRTCAILHKNFSKHSKSVFFTGDKYDINKLKFTQDPVILINPIDCILNFVNALQFFAICVIYMQHIRQKLTVTNCVISFPAVNEIYYAEKGYGAWKNDCMSSAIIRLRTAGESNAQSLTATNMFSSNQQTIRNFGSSCYAIILFASGKVGTIQLDNVDDTIKHAFKIFILESGGLLTTHDNTNILSAVNRITKLQN